MAFPTVAMRENVSKLYVALFGRAPDAEGLGYWAQSLADGKSLATVAKEMYATDAARNYYPKYFSAEEIIESFYSNVLGRSPDAQGKAYWAAKLIAGEDIGKVMEQIIVAVDAYSGTDAAALASKALFSNKAVVAEFYAKNGGDVAGAANALAMVTSDAASVTSAKATIEANKPAAVNSTFTLTVADVAVSEGNSGSKDLTFVLSLDKVPSDGVTVSYQTVMTGSSMGTATPGDDFTIAAGAVTFAAGQQVTTVKISVLGDTAFEANETVKVTFTGSRLTASVTATGTITNDDVDPSTLAQTFVLTNGADTFTGGLNNDTFSGLFDTSGGLSRQTLNSSDTLAGGLGTDTLEVEINGTGIYRPSLSGIESVVVTNSGSGATLSMASSSGYTSIASRSASASFNVTNIADASVALEVSGTGTAVQTQSFSYALNAFTGASDQVSLVVDTVNANTTVTFTDSDTDLLETLSVTASGGNSTLAALNTGDLGVATIKIAGDANLTISANLDSAVKTVSAATAAGNLQLSVGTATAITTGSGDDTVTLGSTTGGDNVTLGNGSDKVFVASGAALGADTISGGSGTDTIQFSATSTALTVADSHFANVTGIETLNASAGTAADSITLGSNALAAGLTSVVLGGTGADALSVSAAFTGLTVTGGTGVDNITVSAAAMMTVNGGGGVDVLTLNTAGATVQIRDVGTVTATGTANDAITLANTAAGSLTIDLFAGSDSLTISGTFGQTIAASNVDTITGGGGADVITISAGVSTVNAGAGNDTITGGTGADSLYGDDGADTFLYASTAALTGDATVVGGSGTWVDVIQLGTSASAYTINDSMFSKVSGIERLDVAAGTAADTITLGSNALAAGLTSVVLGGTGADALSVSAAFTGLTVTGGTGVDNITVSAAAMMTVNGGGGSDTLTLNTAGATVQILDVGTVTATGTANDAITLANTAAGSLTIDLFAGSDSLTISGTFGQTIAASNVDTITGGGGADVITISAGVSTVNAGAGNDTITGGTGADSLYGDDGADTFLYASTAALTGDATVVGGSGTWVDVIQLGTSASAYTINDSMFSKVSGIERLDVSAGTAADTITLGSNALAAGLTSVVLGGTGADALSVSAAFTGLTVTGGTGVDNITVSAAAMMTVNGGGGSDTLTLNTAGATVQILDVGTVTATGTANDAITLANTAAGSLTIDLFAGSDSLTISGTFGQTIAASNVDTITGGSGADVITISAGVSTVTGGDGGDTITSGTGADNLSGDADADTFVIVGTSYLAGDTIAGGSGTHIDVIQFGTSASGITIADSLFANVSGVESLDLRSLTGADTITLGSSALSAAFTSVYLGGTGGDTLNVSSALSGLTVYGGTGVDAIVVSAAASMTVNGGGGSDTLTLNTAGATVQILDVGTVTATGTASDAITLANTAAGSLTIDLGAGSDTLTISSTSFAQTITASGVETITGGSGNDVITLSAGGTLINGGAGTDTLIMTTGDATVSILNMEVVNGVDTSVEYVTLSSATAATVTLTNVDYVYGSSGVDTITDVISLGTAGLGLTGFMASGASGADVISFSIGNDSEATFVAASTSYTVTLLGGAGDDTISGPASLAITGGTGSYGLTVYYSGDTGRDIITLGTSTSTTEVVRFNLLSDLAAGTTLTLADTINNFGTGTDVIDLLGGSLSNGAVTKTLGLYPSDTFSGNFVSAASAALSDLTTNVGAVIFNVTGDNSTGDFTAQSGIDDAVSFITTNIGTAGDPTGLSVILAVNDGTNTALFRYTDAGSTPGIQSSELTLVGVLAGVTTLNAGHFG